MVYRENKLQNSRKTRARTQAQSQKYRIQKKNELPLLSVERYARPAGSQKRKRRNFVAKHASKYNLSETRRDRTKYHRPGERKIETGSPDWPNKKIREWERYNKIELYDPYPYQKRSHDTDSDCNQRLLIGGKRMGKSY